MLRVNRLIWMVLLGFCAAAPLLQAGSAAAESPTRHSVIIKDMTFDPASISISVGDTVTWINNDDRDYCVVARDGSFDSDNIRPGTSFSHEFTKPGTFPYACAYHPRMKGTVNVAEQK